MSKPTFQEGLDGLQSSEATFLRKGDWFGPSWTNHWIKVELTLPKEAAETDDPVVCETALSPERGLIDAISSRV